VRREVYERLKPLLALDDYDPDEGAALINEIMAEDDAGDRSWKVISPTGRSHEPG